MPPPDARSYDRRVIETPEARSVTRRGTPLATSFAAETVVVERFPEATELSAVDAAERFHDVPGLALLESARPGRNARWSYLTADPVTVIDQPAPGPDVFADARRVLHQLDRGAVDDGHLLPFSGGLVGYLSYDLGRRFERLPRIALADQPLPEMRLALHDWVVAWDRRTGESWLAGRAVDGDARRLRRRLEEVRERFASPVPAAFTAEPPDDLIFVSGLDRAAHHAGVETIRDAIAGGEIYQANLTRRLATPFAGDPWPLYRRLRAGDAALFAAYLDLGGNPRRALLSASPEPFLSVDRAGRVASDPIKGTRPRGASPEEDRELACELLHSAKDRAENVMIVDVLRNDLGRVCVPGSVRIPRLCRLERTSAVQHLVSTITGRLRVDRDAFDLLAASFPGGSITGAPKIRAMELLETLEPVRRGPYTGAIGWIGADGAMATSIAIRTFVADGSRLTLHVGGGITWRSDPGAEWDETVAKARGPLSAIGARESN